MELVRLVLLECEWEEGYGEKPDLSHYTDRQRAYHAALLVEAGLVKGDVLEDNNGFPTGAVLIRPTWAGHEFLDAARNDVLWRKATHLIKKAGITVTLPILTELLTVYAKAKLGLK